MDSMDKLDTSRVQCRVVGTWYLVQAASVVQHSHCGREMMGTCSFPTMFPPISNICYSYGNGNSFPII
ncbi:unnamed protein product [Arabis nemorensis]|uniref:Uncharacterized protein n=1 Tax=Arabis nemorensis TaxID=586526 RepID=A0A565AW43_9BRAS|nr:unnamed protein product [Arabis nemorensis]